MKYTVTITLVLAALLGTVQPATKAGLDGSGKVSGRNYRMLKISGGRIVGMKNLGDMTGANSGQSFVYTQNQGGSNDGIKYVYTKQTGSESDGNSYANVFNQGGVFGGNGERSFAYTNTPQETDNGIVDGNSLANTKNIGALGSNEDSRLVYAKIQVADDDVVYGKGFSGMNHSKQVGFIDASAFDQIIKRQGGGSGSMSVGNSLIDGGSSSGGGAQGGAYEEGRVSGVGGGYEDVHAPRFPQPQVKVIRVYVPHPYPVVVPKPFPVHIPHPYAVQMPVQQRVMVPVIKHVQVPVDKPYHVTVEKHYPQYIEKPYPINVEKHVYYDVPRPYPVQVPIYKHVYLGGHGHDGKGGEVNHAQ